MGKLEHLNAKLLSNAIEMRFPEFESKTSTWQNRGKFRKWVWLRFKRPQYSNAFYSISIGTIEKSRNNYIFKVYLEVDDKEAKDEKNKNMRAEIYGKFTQTILTLPLPDETYCYEGTAKNGDPWRIKNILIDRKYEKITLNKYIDCDYTQPDEVIVDKICEAFEQLIPCYDALFTGVLPPKHNTWVVSCNYEQFDIISAFNQLEEIDWHQTQQSKDIKIGDTVFVYVSKPFSRIMYQCEVTATDIAAEDMIDDSQFVKDAELKKTETYYRIKLIKKINDLTLDHSSLEQSTGIKGGAIQGQRKLDDKQAVAISAIAEKQPIEEAFSNDEIKAIETIPEDKLEEFINNDITDDTAGYEYKETIAKVRIYNKEIIDDLKKEYKGQCQLCGERCGEKFGVEIVDAHHIEYFSKTQNNDSSNIIILCPNCHRLIHKCNPTYNSADVSFDFGGQIIPVAIKGHLGHKNP